MTTAALTTAPGIPDAEVIDVGFDFAFMGGAGYSFQAVQINKGEDQGWHFYNTTNANIGFGASVGVSYSQVDFNHDNETETPLNRNAFDGRTSTYTAGVGPDGVSHGYATTDPNGGIFTMNPAVRNILYKTKGVGISFGADIGFMWQASKSKLSGAKF